MQMQQFDLVPLVREFMAVTSVNGNVLRKQGAGVVQAIQRGLCQVRLDDLPTHSAAAYLEWLDRRTFDVLGALTSSPRPWGTVRKALNLFVRSCVCDNTLRATYRLDAIETWAEMPLDSVVATALIRAAGPDRLPPWTGLKHLVKASSDAFQAYAEEYTEQLGLPARIYLDYHLWLRNRGGT